MISIILPHLSTATPVPTFKKYLEQNTVNEYELIEVLDWTDVYAAYNHGASLAKYDIIIMMNDDMFVAPGWDVNFVKYVKPKTFAMMWLVESGHIPVNSRMLEYDCGRTLETFDYDKFINYINNVDIPELTEGAFGAWMPIGFHKSTWIPFPNDNKYPYPNDIDLIDVTLPQMGYTPLKVKSFAYHLQGYSRR
jgi:hypothetical protein